MFVQTVQQLEGVATSYEDCLGAPSRFCRALGLMNAGQFEAPALESFPRSGRVVILLPQSVRHKQDLGHVPGAEKVADGVSGVLQVPGNIIRTSNER